MAKVDVLLGLQWGDEGKGKVIDVLTPNYDVITRFQGGPNAGHTLEFNGEKYPVENAELFNNETTGETVPFSGQEANFHNVAKWTENGEEVKLHRAIFSE